MNKGGTSAENSTTIRRTFNAPRERVFAAWTKPDQLRGWWRANPEFSTPIVEVDLRVGGKYRLGMQDPTKDSPFVCFGEFREVDPPSKLVYTWSWDSPAMDVGVTIVTVEFHDRGGKTEIVLTHAGFPSADAAAQHQHGWDGCLGQLGPFVESAE